MTLRTRSRPTACPELKPPHLSGRPQRGAATAEFAIGVMAAVLIAALLAHLVLTGFFEVLVQSLFERGLDLAVDLLAATVSWSLSDISTVTWSGLSNVSGAGGAWDAVIDGSSTVASGAVSVSRATASGFASIAEATVHATAQAVRWAGGPVRSALPW